MRPSGRIGLQPWARQQYDIRLLIVVIPHTLGRHLNFNCHLHILVSEGSLRELAGAVGRFHLEEVGTPCRHALRPRRGPRLHGSMVRRPV